MVSGRALHFVFKIADRALTARFYREILGMKVLRHEEFADGCEAACNGPYDTRWSKTMIGYGSEDTHFVVELTYNYGISSYEKGNDFIGMTIKSKEIIKRAQEADWPIKKEGNLSVLEAPGGYKYFIEEEPQPVSEDPVQKVILASSNLQKSIDYWNGILGLKIYNQDERSATFGFGDNQAKVELRDIGGPVERAKAFGRVAFSCPYAEQEEINKKIEASNNKILFPLVTLDTPGKASVRVIILSDPDGHEICFVEDEGYRKLSVADENGDELLDKAMRLELKKKQA
ncbi:Glyoxalase domain-containing protein 4 [Gryllus bimaculatus]|nr:Glyoxalase domain-containing protein 4 [Gryllus bimaculatus]